MEPRLNKPEGLPSVFINKVNNYHKKFRKVPDLIQVET